MSQRSIIDFGTLGQTNNIDFGVVAPANETRRERRNRLARERRARQRAIRQAQSPYPIVPGESQRDRRNRLARERRAMQRSARNRSRRAIDDQLAGERELQADEEGPFRLRTRFGNVSVLDARENLFRTVRRARTQVQEQRFLDGTGESATYIPNGYQDLDRILNTYYPMLVDGERFIILFNGKGYTLSLEKYEELKTTLNARRINGHWYGSRESDMEFVIDSVEQGGAFTISRPEERVGNNFTFATGEFFPYIHTFCDEHITKILARLGCWKEVNSDNYKENCLWLAFKDAGVEDHTLEAMKTEFLDRKIARKNIRKIAEDHKLLVRITTEGKTDGYGLKYGPRDGFPVELALIKDHYIHNFRTDICSYAFKNYDELKDKEEWWRFYKADRKAKDGERGINALALIRLLLDSEYLTPISAVTNGVFRTQYHNKFDMDEFSTLKYESKYCRLKHPLRDGKGPYRSAEDDALYPEKNDDEMCDYDMGESLDIDGLVDLLFSDEEEVSELEKLKIKIVKARNALNAETLEWLDDKFTNCKMGLEEQLKYLKKHLEPNFTYDFDFETCPFGKHKEFLVCYKEDSDSPIQEKRGFDCAKDFLDDIAMRHGISANGDTSLEKLKAPVIKLRAHNITYDASFLFPHLRRIQTIERGTSIVCGSARYYCKTGEATNGCNGELREWMKTHGEALFISQNMNRRIETWKRATSTVNKTTQFIENYKACEKLHGIGPVVLEILKQAPWDTFKPSVPFYVMKVIDIRFQDTLKMIPEPLSKFGKMFNLEQEKEVLPYTLFTESFVENGGVCMWGDIVSNSKHFEDFDQLRNNLRNWGCERVDENGVAWYDMMEYAVTYCRADVDVLQKGWRKFRDMVLSEMDMDINCYPTVASMTDAYYIEQGIYEGVNEMAGVPLKFHANASVGGRVMCANNERVFTKEEMDDTDANSLYPSAQIRLGGFLKGRPKVWHPGVDLNKADGYCIKIEITHIGRDLRFPICRLKTKEGGCDWTNDLVGKTLTVDKWTLEDLVRHQGARFKILQGYYYDEERNNRLGEVVKDMFDRRQRYKAEGNPLQLVLKIALNSGYGICGLKPIDTDTKYVSQDRKANFIQNHFNHIKSFDNMPNGEFRFDLHKQIDTHYNRQHCAMEVLSMSKTIMNEPMVLAEDLGIKIAYQDTDSMHVTRKDSKRLEVAYNKKYGKNLLGSGEGSYGQFSTDFEFSDAWHFRDGKFRKVGKSIKPEGEVKAKRSIFLGKKSYIDELCDDAGNIAWHMRMKGIPSKCMLAKVASCFDKDPMKLYEWLMLGKSCEFDLTADGNCCFKTTKSHQVYTQTMTRRVIFPVEVDLSSFEP